MAKEKKIVIGTEKNWKMAIYTTLVGIVLLFISIDLFNFEDGFGLGNFIFAAMFIFGILSIFAFPYLFFSKEKILTFIINEKNLIMSSSSNKEDTDFNKSVPFAEIKKFYHKKNIKCGGFSEIVNGLFYTNRENQEKLFLDLTMEVKISDESVEKILQFVDDCLKESK